MSIKIRWTPGAANDLEEIAAFLEVRSPQVAANMIARIIKRVATIPAFPRLGPKIHEFNDENLRELLESSYRILYRILDEEHIEIEAVVHAARQIPNDDDV